MYRYSEAYTEEGPFCQRDSIVISKDQNIYGSLNFVFPNKGKLPMQEYIYSMCNETLILDTNPNIILCEWSLILCRTFQPEWIQEIVRHIESYISYRNIEKMFWLANDHNIGLYQKISSSLIKNKDDLDLREIGKTHLYIGSLYT